MANITNDLDETFDTDYHLDALDFLKMFDDNSADMVLFDSPYSPRQVSECYKKLGKTVDHKTTQSSYWSNLKKEITKILFDKGYILNFKFVEDGPQGSIKVALKYDRSGRVNALKALKRVSRPGLRKYVGYREMPRVLNGLGIAILSTSKGVMTDKEASQLKVGGEVLCYIY